MKSVIARRKVLKLFLGTVAGLGIGRFSNIWPFQKRVANEPQDKELILVHLTDTHVATVEENPEPLFPFDPHVKDLKRSFKWVSAAVEKINKIQPDLAVITGDIIDNRAKEPKDIYKVAEIINALECPYYVTIGNHDRSAKDEFLDSFNTELNFSFSYDMWHFIALDGRRGKLPENALDFLEAELHRTETKNKHVVVLTHWPFLIPKTHQLLADKFYDVQLTYENADKALEIIERFSHVHMVLAGHTHRRTELERNGIHHITTSALVESPYRFRIIRLKEGTSHWGFQRVNLD